jgi:hypothetical protein
MIAPAASPTGRFGAAGRARMAEYTYEQLREMTVSQLREIVAGLPDQQGLEGYATMHKDHLLPALCARLGIHAHHAAAAPQKSQIKAKIKSLKAQRDEALAARDRQRLAGIRRQIHKLKHKLRRSAT